MAKEHIIHPESFTEFYSEQNKLDVKRIIDWLNESKTRTQSHLVKQISYSPASVSTLINGVHPKDPNPVIDVIIPIIDDAIVPLQVGEFVKTSTYHLVKIACDKARETRRFSVIAGSPGVGKSKSLEHYAQLNPNTIYIEGSEFTTSSVVLDELIEALGIKLSSNNTKASKAKLIINKLNGSNRLIILDEADKCAADVCDPLRTISDRTGCGVVLTGNHQLRENIIVGNNRYDLISDRVVFWPSAITAITLEDCSNLMRPYFTDDMLGEDYDVLVKYAHELTKGSARKLIVSLIPNVMSFVKARKRHKHDVAIDCKWFKDIAQKYMGIQNPPPLPQKRSTIAIPA
jgi:DNA transposition AAA+ family ATPase